jgi:hypothetical protein
MASETPPANLNIFLPTGIGLDPVDESLIPPGLEPSIYPAENGLNFSQIPRPYEPSEQPKK